MEKATAVAGTSRVRATRVLSLKFFFFEACPSSHHQLGVLAQLGERLICIQEVIGSIPIGSTKNCGHVKRTGVERLWRFVRAGSVAQVVRAHA